MTSPFPQPRFHGRADERKYQGRLGPVAMKHFRYHVRLILTAVVVGVLGTIGSITLSLRQHHTNVASVIVAEGLLIVFAVAGMVEYRRVKFLAGNYHGLTHHESRHLDISSPERFDASLAVALERRARAQARTTAAHPESTPPPHGPAPVYVPDRLLDGSDPFARIHPPVSGLAILALAISVFAAVFFLPAGIMGAVLSMIALRSILRRERRGWWLVLPAVLIGLGAFIIGTVRQLLT